MSDSVLKYYYQNIVKQDLMTKFNYENSLEIPALKKIVIHFGVSHSTLRSLLPSLAALQLVSSQKPYMVASKTNIRLKVKGGVAIGCKIDLRGKEKDLFLEKLIVYILPRLKNFRYVVAETNVYFKVDNLFLFKELEKEYDYFQDLSKLNVNLNFKAKSSQEVKAFLSALRFPSTP
jgi:large subunit ribosomal protein L5